MAVFWDVDAPATLDRVQSNPTDRLRALIPRYDWSSPMAAANPLRAYRAQGARECVPIYNALDPSTHFPAPPDPGSRGLGFVGNRLPDREARVEEFFFRAAELAPRQRFLLAAMAGGNYAPQVKYAGHLYTADHNAFNSTPRAVLNISRESMARYGFSPATRVFEAAGAGACLLTDAWDGIELFLEPGKETLVRRTARKRRYARHFERAMRPRDRRAARKRILAQHTYAHRARLIDAIWPGDATAGAVA